VTRGYGLLEGFLAKQRSKVVDELIPSTYRNGRILDIGCGNYPYFLLNTKFSEKYGLDKITKGYYAENFQNSEIIFINYDIEKNATLPFGSELFDVVTMLAVIEHVETKSLTKIMSEIHRILKSGGMYVLTTPAPRAAFLLRCMAKLRLVSPIEIEEHKDAYSTSRISSMLQEANFSEKKIRCGYFEIFMNIWATAKK